MGEFIGTKTAAQAKSFDQRKKKEYMINGSNLTMVEWVVKILKENFLEEPIVKEKLKELKEALEKEEVDNKVEIDESI